MGMQTYTGGRKGPTSSATEPIKGREKDMTANDGGGFSFRLDSWKKLDRFLILGTEGGTYYVNEQKHTERNTHNVEALINEDGVRVVNRVVEISEEGRAPKNDPAIFALALCFKFGDKATVAAAKAALPKVCRITTHLFQFVEAAKALGCWKASVRKAVSAWYNTMEDEKLALNIVKYRNREGWSHADVLRLVRTAPKEPVKQALLRYAVAGMDGMEKRPVKRMVTKNGAPVLDGEGKPTFKETEYPAIEKGLLPKIVHGFELAVHETDEKKLIKLIEEYNLPRECIPNEFLNSTKVWEALLMSGKGMPMTAMIRNLGKMSEIGLLGRLSNAAQFVAERLNDEDQLKKARIHPLNVLVALKTYSQGHGMRGNLSWQVNEMVVDGLDSAFYKSFKFVEPTGKAFYIGVDCSGSMSSPMGNLPLQCAEAAAAMAMVAARTEKNYTIRGFTHHMVDLGITAKDTLQTALRKVQRSDWGSTNPSACFEDAIRNKLPVGVFQIITDNDVNTGVHPSQSLKEFRKKMGIPAKMVVMGMTANEVSIADPNDAGMMDVAGFDTSVPQIIADFVRG